MFIILQRNVKVDSTIFDPLNKTKTTDNLFRRQQTKLLESKFLVPIELVIISEKYFGNVN